jgi:hypothetical protein
VNQTVSRSHPVLKAALRATFPDYRGRKVRVAPYTRPLFLQTTWSEGSRDEVKAIRLADGQVADASGFAGWGAAEEVACPAGHVLVVHTVSYGHDLGITFYVPVDPAPSASYPLTTSQQSAKMASSARDDDR